MRTTLAASLSKAADFWTKVQLEETKPKVYAVELEDAFSDLSVEWGRAVKIAEQLLASLQ